MAVFWSLEEDILMFVYSVLIMLSLCWYSKFLTSAKVLWQPRKKVNKNRQDTEVEKVRKDVTVLNVSWGQAWYCRSVGWSVYEQFSRKTSLRILTKLGMKLQHNEGKKRTWPFVRKNSRSLIIHENAFWPFSWLWDLGWISYCILW